MGKPKKGVIYPSTLEYIPSKTALVITSKCSVTLHNKNNVNSKTPLTFRTFRQIHASLPCVFFYSRTVVTVKVCSKCTQILFVFCFKVIIVVFKNVQRFPWRCRLWLVWKNAEERTVFSLQWNSEGVLVELRGSTGSTVSQTTPEYTCMSNRQTNA